MEVLSCGSLPRTLHIPCHIVVIEGATMIPFYPAYLLIKMVQLSFLFERFYNEHSFHYPACHFPETQSGMPLGCKKPVGKAQENLVCFLVFYNKIKNSG